jgi:hypothetical protein
MDPRFRAWLTLALILPPFWLLARTIARTLPRGLMRCWVWVAASTVFLAAAGRHGLLQAVGLDPHAVIHGVLMFGLVLVLFEDLYTRVFRRPPP